MKMLKLIFGCFLLSYGCIQSGAVSNELSHEDKQSKYHPGMVLIKMVLTEQELKKIDDLLHNSYNETPCPNFTVFSHAFENIGIDCNVKQLIDVFTVSTRKTSELERNYAELRTAVMPKSINGTLKTNKNETVVYMFPTENIIAKSQDTDNKFLLPFILEKNKSFTL